MDLSLVFEAVGAVAAVIAVVFGIPPFLKWWREGKRPGLEGINSAPTIFNATSVGQRGGTTAGVVKGGETTPISIAGQTENSFSPTKRKVSLLDETINLRSGEYEECHKKLRMDTRITGTVTELEGQTFSFYIMNRKTFKLFRDGERGEELYSAIEVSSDSFRRTIPTDDTWYFIVDAYHKQNDRSIQLRVNALEP